MYEKPAISILVPIYNVERYLEVCLDSIQDQSFTDYEVICINDGSTDSSREIIERYIRTDARFKVIDKENSGYGASMNMGLEKAEGRYISILESDDRYLDNALELLYSTAESFDAEVVKADFNLYWSTPTPRQIKFGFNDGFESNVLLSSEEQTGVFYKKPSIWSAIYLKDFLDRNDIVFQETPGASYQDAGFNFKVWASAKRIVLLEDAVLDYRQDNEQSSVNSPQKVFCVCDEYRCMDEWIAEDEDARGWTRPILGRMKFDSYLWNYDRLSEELGMTFLTSASEELRDDLENGRIDLSLFEPWAEADLMALVESPEKFKRCRDDVKSPGKINTFKHYYRLGGWPLIIKVLSYKRNKKNARY